MLSNLSTENLARASALHPRRVVFAWLALFVLAIASIATLFADSVTTQFEFLNSPESKRALEATEDGLRGPEQITEIVVIRAAPGTSAVTDPEFRNVVDELASGFSELGPDVVSGAVNYFDLPAGAPQAEFLVSRDGNTLTMPVVMAGGFEEAEANIGKVHDLIDEISEDSLPAGYGLYIAGEATFSADFAEGNQKDAEQGEMVAMPIALVILAVVFGAVAAAVMPMILAIASIVIAIGAVSVVGTFFQLSVFVQNVITMIGLAVGIDYALFIVSRYREERRAGREKIDAIGVAGATASRAVLFSGVTVVLALVGLLILPMNVFLSLGIGAIFVVTIAVVATLTLLPAALSIMGDGIERLRVPFIKRSTTISDVTSQSGFWAWTIRGVMRWPWVALIVTAGFLVVATIPYFDLNAESAGVDELPDEFRAKQAFEVLQEEFGYSPDAPITIVIEGDIDSDGVKGALEDLRARLAEDLSFGPPGALEVEGPAASGARDVAVLSVPATGGAWTEPVVDSVEKLRDIYIPAAFAGVDAEVNVGGLTSEEIDTIDLTSTYQPYVIGLVLALSFVLLMIVFRSVVVPVTAIILNLLSVGAAYGVVVFVYQQGNGNELFGFPETPTIQPWLPLMMFTILFGLSMDYQVFLLSRIRERYDRTGNNAEAVAHGIRSTAGLITGAALIMVAVFGGFASGDLVPVGQFGFGMAVAILIDATVIRTLLVPAAMKILGDTNWYFPKFLHWLPDVRVEGVEPAPSPSGGDPEPVGVPAGGDD